MTSRLAAGTVFMMTLRKGCVIGRVLSPPVRGLEGYVIEVLGGSFDAASKDLGAWISQRHDSPLVPPLVVCANDFHALQVAHRIGDVASNESLDDYWWLENPVEFDPASTAFHPQILDHGLLNDGHPDIAGWDLHQIRDQRFVRPSRETDLSHATIIPATTFTVAHLDLFIAMAFAYRDGRRLPTVPRICSIERDLSLAPTDLNRVEITDCTFHPNKSVMRINTTAMPEPAIKVIRALGYKPTGYFIDVLVTYLIDEGVASGEIRSIPDAHGVSLFGNRQSLTELKESLIDIFSSTTDIVQAVTGAELEGISFADHHSSMPPCL